MKVKSISLLVKIILVVLGFAFSILKWCDILPNADFNEIWKACAFAYGISMGDIDFNITRDNWVEKKEKAE